KSTATEENCIGSFWDSYLCLSVDKVILRHPQTDRNKHASAGPLADLVNLIHTKRNQLAKLRGHVRINKQDSRDYSDLELTVKSVRYAEQEAAPIQDQRGEHDSGGKPEIIGTHWRPNSEVETAITRASERLGDLVFLKSQISALQNPQIASTISLTQGHRCRDAMLAIFSVFRRPRSLATIRSMCERWGVEGGPNSNAINVREVRKAIDDLIRTRIVHDQSPFARLHEGGSYWMFREQQHSYYAAMTESLSVTKWVLELRGNFKGRKAVPAALIDGLVGIALHIEASRVYYADTFMPTKDISAFYEYLYHRCWALRTISLLLDMLRTESSAVRILQSDLELGFDSSVRLLGTFASLDKFFTKGTFSQKILVEGLISLRAHCLSTLLGAIVRHEEFLRARATPSTLLGWIRQFQMLVLPEIAEKIYEGPDRRLVGARKYPKLMGEEISRFDRKIAGIKESLDSLLLQISRDGAFSDNVHDDDGVYDVDGTETEDAPDRAEDDQKERQQDRSKEREEAYTEAKQAEKRLEKREEDARNLQKLACPLWTFMDRSDETVELSTPDGTGRSGKHKKKFKDRIREAREAAIECEYLLRESTRTEAQDALHRSRSLAMLARSEYLDGYFRQAHHRLDLASSGLTDSRSHAVSRAMIHIYRAELLVYSANHHYQKTLIEVGTSPFSVASPYGVRKELKKVYRAEQEIRRSLVALRESPYQVLWGIVSHLGGAQVQLERLLLESELVYVTRRAISQREFSELSGKCERMVLDGLRHLRAALDLIPIETELWENVSNKKGELVRLEMKTYAIWRQLYVASAFMGGLLSAWHQSHVLTGSPVSFDGLAHEILAVIAHAAEANPHARWARWNASVRFENFARLGGADIGLELPDFTLTTEDIRSAGSASLRTLQTLAMKRDLTPDSDGKPHALKCMWNFRRDPKTAGP
ncbi:MAG: hypothetical protein KDA66_02990, partial [Planctomycetaceae bacterium]|nr:hypothetical protein [Planctomycetaceae bacterium]